MIRPELQSFSQHLFWDTRKEDVDLDANAAFLVQRVLEYGLYEDWKILRSIYGIPRIVEIAKKLRTLEPKALSFICALSNTDKNQYRCYILRQSNPPHLNF